MRSEWLKRIRICLSFMAIVVSFVVGRKTFIDIISSVNLIRVIKVGWQRITNYLFFYVVNVISLFITYLM